MSATLTLCLERITGYGSCMFNILRIHISIGIKILNVCARDNDPT